jgi:hypothetical protein
MLPLVDVLHFSRVQILEWYSVIHGKAAKSCAFIKLETWLKSCLRIIGGWKGWFGHCLIRRHLFELLGNTAI